MRIVIKVGTNVLIDSSHRLVESRFANIAKDVAVLAGQGHEVVLVTSGAVAAGREAAPELANTQYRKILAAIGQQSLMRLYSENFKKFGLPVGQCLISRYDIINRESYENLVAMVESFFVSKVIPVINENDVSLNFGGNDSLAAMIAIAIKADQLIFLTHQQGLLTSDPTKDHGAQLIPVVTRVDKEIERLCSKGVSASGTGGMIRKVKAAQQAVFAGIPAYIADGRKEGAILKILNGESFGTRFIACAVEDLSDSKRWLMAAKGFGQIIIDEGAAAALRKGKSLLFPGVLAIKGLFEPGSIVEVACDGNLVCYGRVNFGEKEMQKALNLKEKKQSTDGVIDKEVMHRNYMIILKS
jgi:glutamate 5-kinase